MQPQRLTESVLIHGHGPLGLKTDLVIRSVDLPGWNIQFASVREDNPVFPLREGNVRFQSFPTNNVEVAFSDEGRENVLRVVEHLLALREGMGLYDQVLLVVGRRGIPFTGHSGHFLEHVRPALVPTTLQTRCWTTDSNIGPIRTLNGKGCVEFIPSETGVLQLVVSIDYPQYPEVRRQEFIWSSSENTFDDVAQMRGELKPMFGPFVRFSKHLRWPHAWAFADIKNMPHDEWWSNVVRHRALDLLGELGVVTHSGRLSGICYCHCAGHREVVELVHEMQARLVEVRQEFRAAAE